jgi:DNA mismatch repair ATPase MutS
MLPQKEFHLSQIVEHQKQITELKGKTRFILFSRLILFLAAVVIILLLIKTQPLLAWSAAGFTVILFLLLLKLETHTSREKTYLKNLVHVNELEIDLLERRFETRDEGKEFLDVHHPFVSDLDIFGRRSVFQLLNRSSTLAGRSTLAQWLTDPLIDKNQITLRQKAVRELADRTDWRQRFSALGKEKPEKKKDKEHIQSWLNEKKYFSSSFLKISSVLLPVLTLSAIGLYLAGIIPSGPPLLCFFVQLFISGYQAKKTNISHDTLSRKSDAIDKYSSLISLIEKDTFESHNLQSLQARLNTKGETASQSIRKLKALVNALDARKNLVVAALLNGILLWDVNIMKRIEDWRCKHKASFLDWIDLLAGFDAYVSLAGYAASHPESVFPEMVSGEFLIEAEDLGHPMIEESRLVRNNYSIQGFAKVDLLTGANMAGKSTFLRTIGVNLCMAMIGAPVCAKKFKFSPLLLFTSLRTNDSLQENESFFYAELKRLHMLIQSYEQGRPVFFLLDEILKGTNSKDQHLGAVALTKKILRLNGVGIVATHDVELSQLSTELPGQIRNLCFEITITDDKLNFDYTLREGVCRTMNASFLMKKMGIID